MGLLALRDLRRPTRSRISLERLFISWVSEGRCYDRLEVILNKRRKWFMYCTMVWLFLSRMARGSSLDAWFYLF